ncbi:DUF1178 family protein [Paracoccus spongiarum]|uniref:DUF1178 family protein n=1 Tax=Paracoccus spongiarum TaxID=3064387 RepID=A0ABT9JBP2_9RHOB|nr:DUF1178 family protein [Paracoccus sp. 2205BS29-5]MDP5307258.1 DUF1178 family protein [Paracoccus sp. 2205BS29-5]
MIRYALRCDKRHDFDGWFRSSEGFESLRRAGQVVCAQCGSTQVEKALMAPAVPKEAADQPAAPAAQPSSHPLSRPRSAAEAALASLRRHVEANSDYVGMNFVAEARAMHEGAAPHRAIHGEARPDEARKLIEDGAPVAPLPFLPRQKSN